jgi:hypothetical protein
MVDYQIYDNDCRDGDMKVSNDTLSSQIGELTGTAGTGTGLRTIKVIVEINSETITSASNIYSEKTVNGELFASITFCVGFSLSTSSTSSIEVNFVETLVTLKVDLTDGFEIGTVAVAPKDILAKTANQAYEVEASFCDNNAIGPRNQGSLIKICVKPKADAIAAGVFMREILSFEFVRVDISSTQKAIVAGKPSLNGLTKLDCQAGYEICSFSTVLMAKFYASPGTVSGNGIASMQFGGSAGVRRHLRRSGESRSVQEVAEAVGAAEFELDFQITPISEVFEKSSSSSETGQMHTVAMGLVAIVVVIGLVLVVWSRLYGASGDKKSRPKDPMSKTLLAKSWDTGTTSSTLKSWQTGDYSNPLTPPKKRKKQKEDKRSPKNDEEPLTPPKKRKKHNHKEDKRSPKKKSGSRSRRREEEETRPRSKNRRVTRPREREDNEAPIRSKQHSRSRRREDERSSG